MSGRAVRRLGRAVVAGTAVLAGAAGVAFAVGSFTGSGEALQACAKKENGQLRLVTRASDCKPSERAVSWSSGGSLDGLAGSACTINGRAGETLLRFPPDRRGYTLLTQCIAADVDEPNDTRATAKPLVLRGSGDYVVSSFFPAGDSDDWYTLDATAVNFFVFGAEIVPVTFELYKDGALASSAVVAPDDLSGFSYDNSTDPAPHDWEIHVSGTSPGFATITVYLAP